MPVRMSTIDYAEQMNCLFATGIFHAHGGTQKINIGYYQATHRNRALTFIVESKVLTIGGSRYLTVYVAFEKNVYPVNYLTIKLSMLGIVRTPPNKKNVLLFEEVGANSLRLRTSYSGYST
jgi:hypothetical protein